MNPYNEQHHKIARFPINSAFVAGKMTKEIINNLPEQPGPVVVVCIGTDRSTGDSLGPLTGTLLSERRPRHLHVYGTLEEPVHAKNLEKYLALINKNHPDAFIIAVDACLGRVTSIGSIVIADGPLKPGAAMNKNLPETGNMHIAGIVNAGGMMEFLVLQTTRLNLVLKMARKLAEALKRVDRSLGVPHDQPGSKVKPLYYHQPTNESSRLV
ncbi:spore protease YyaC [Salipaludibacillus aurantiacus]|uniref:Putative sporulation protein YyaC n=1 Tax=Salipaludibacillus aurantiacus TaxID=1601833 RepID=A0A1H9WYC5_9BACI|nr:spore protease YyaC [Salipaludibacillus aurantiacus]SES38844.1 putative sporulation protein YyaC [Salipaludibacillus aurantiacus]